MKHIIENHIYHNDCLTNLQHFPRESIDLVVTSPPYDNLRAYRGKEFNFAYFKKMVHELYRTLKPGGVICWVVGDQVVAYNNGRGESGNSFRHALYFIDAGFCLFDTMIYEKPGTSFPGPSRYYQIFEYMFVISKGKPKTINRICDRKNTTAGDLVHGKGRQRDGNFKLKAGAKVNRKIREFGVRFNIWRFPGGHENDKLRYKHPAIFPYKLCNDLMISFSNEMDVVYDPFMGSGTTAIAAIANNRKYVGSEISQEYIDLSLEVIKRRRDADL